MIFQDILEDINKVREEVNKEFNLNNSFVDMCDVVCERIVEKLKERNIRGDLIYGTVWPNWSDGVSDEDRLFHYWITLRDLEVILDPTYDQFDFKHMVFKKDDEQAKKYIAGLIEKSF